MITRVPTSEKATSWGGEIFDCRMECLVIKPVIQAFQVYLLGRFLFIQTEHRALQWLSESKKVIGDSPSGASPSNRFNSPWSIGRGERTGMRTVCPDRPVEVTATLQEKGEECGGLTT